MSWRNLGVFTLSSNWQFTPLITSSIVRVTHIVDAGLSGIIRGVIAQAISTDTSFFDLRRLNYRPEKEVFLMLNFDGLVLKKLALRRTDTNGGNWAVKIEELEGVADINLPLEIADVSGLQSALNEKADITETNEAIAQKANAVHGHQIADVSGLQATLDGFAPGDWQNLILLNSWFADSSGNYQPARCRKILPHLIEVQGGISRSGGAANSVVAQLPEGFRPAKNFFTVLANSGNTFRAEIRSNGEIFIAGSTSTSHSLHFFFGV